VLDLRCIGDVMLDVRADAGLLARGGDVHGRVRLRPGGTSANAAVWAAWSGARAGVTAAVGDDVAGELCVEALRARGVDVTGVTRRPAGTGVMLVLTEQGERSMIADRGANAALTVEDLPGDDAAAVLVSGYLFLQEPGHEVAAAAIAGAAGSLCAIDAASWPLLESFGVARFLEVAGACDAILANEREAATLTGRAGAEAAAALGERFRIAAVKRGETGAALVVDGLPFREAGRPLKERDPTGAGDAFDGVLLAGLVRGLEPADALAFACRAGERVAGGEESWPAVGERRS